MNKEYYRQKLIEYKNHFFTICEYEMATELRNLEIIHYLWFVWKEENFLTEIKKFCKIYNQEWILRDLKIDLISR